MMGIITPLQIIAANGLLGNQGLKTLPAALVSAINQYNSTTLMQNFFAAVNYYKAQSFFTESTFDQLMSMGSTDCPALGNSIPESPVGSYPNLLAEYLTINTVTDDSTVDPSGFSNLIEQTGSAYLGNGDVGKFAQGFLAVQGYINTVNSFINSVDNSQTYLGPTFTTMSALTTNNISRVTTNIPRFAVDLRNTGRLINTKNLDLFGTPAGLLQQISNVSGTTGTSLPGVVNRLRNLNNSSARRPLNDSEIRNLVNDNRVKLFNPTGISSQEFDQLQKIAYQAMTEVEGQDLLDILSILDVSTPNINTMADLLDLKKIFPNSYTTLQMPTASGPMPIYLSNGSVDQTLAPIVNAILPAPSGCDELGKIIPPDQAVANKAFQSGLQQITNIPQIAAPDLAVAMSDTPRTAWDSTVPYLANNTVALAVPAPSGPAQLTPSTVYYRAQQDVPAGTNITDTNYWQPYTPRGMNTMAGLPLIESLTSAVPAAVASNFNSQNATGSGPNGTITVCDVIGTAVDHWDFASRLIAVADIIAPDAPTAFSTALSTLEGIYTSIASSSSGTVAGLIANANTEIDTLKNTYPTEVAELNTAWNYIANYLNREKGYQNQAGLEYFQLVPNEKVSVYALVQSLSQLGPQCQACGPNQFLQEVVDDTSLTGQAVIGSLRESQNQAQLASSNLLVNTTPDMLPEVTPPCAVTPVT